MSQRIFQSKFAPYVCSSIGSSQNSTRIKKTSVPGIYQPLNIKSRIPFVLALDSPGKRISTEPDTDEGNKIMTN